jgi:hypothetical protein
VTNATTQSVPAGLLMILRRQPVRWSDLGLTREELFAVCDREELRGFLFSHIAVLDAAGDWPQEIRDELAQSAREETVREMLRREEIAAALGTLAAAGSPAIVLKGTALAYSVYDNPIARPRLDTDLLIDAARQVAARDALASCGYTAPPYCDQLFSQLQMEKVDAFGTRHVLDVHWKISTQPVFADVLAYEEMTSRAAPLAALGPAAIGPCAIDALLLACIHPVMHHQNAERLLWIYDTHLLASSLTRDEFHAFARLAHDKKIATVCALQLRRAQSLFGTRVPADVLDSLSTAADEPSAAYLASHRTWRHELASSIGGLPRTGDRLALLRDVLLPSPAYMLGVYGLRGKPLGPWLLPALYVHRNIRGAWKILTGKK